MKWRVRRRAKYDHCVRVFFPKTIAWGYACILIAAYGISCDRGEEFTTEPGTMSVSLAASPSGGVAPLIIGLTAAVVAPPVPPLTYRFDCTNDGEFEVEVRTDVNPYSAADACTYADTGTYTPKVTLEYAGGSISATTSVTVTSGQTASSDSVVVLMDDNFFLSADVTAEPGTRIIWRNTGSRPHTATSDDGLWDSGTKQPGESWSWTVPIDAQPDSTLPYYCVFHGDTGGIGMSGTIRVGTHASSTDSVVVQMQDNFFTDATITVMPGTKIVWDNTGNRPHTSTADDGTWDSGTVDAGQRWSWIVPASTPLGTTLPYYCQFHGDAGGQGMAGLIRVDSAPPPPPPPTSVDTVTMTADQFIPERVEIPVGGMVTWIFSGITHNVTFDGSAPPGGNIPDTSPGSAISRTFVAAGDYDYECTLHNGHKGRVRVR